MFSRFTDLYQNIVNKFADQLHSEHPLTTQGNFGQVKGEKITFHLYKVYNNLSYHQK